MSEAMIVTMKKELILKYGWIKSSNKCCVCNFIIYPARTQTELLAAFATNISFLLSWLI